MVITLARCEVKAMIALLIVVFVITPLLVYPLRYYNQFDFDYGLDDSDNLAFKHALYYYQKGDLLQAKHYLLKINQLEKNLKRFVFYLGVLEQASEHKKVIDLVDLLPERIKVLHFDKLIELYIKSAIEIEDYQKIASFIELQRINYPGSIHHYYKKSLYALINNENYAQVILLTDIFPSTIYLEGEKNFLLGVAHYRLGYYQLARGFFRNVLASDNSRLYRITNDFLSAISYRLKDSDDLSDHRLYNSTQSVFNFILLFLEESKIDEAISLSLVLDSPELKKLTDLFIYWENKHYKAAQVIVESLDINGLLDKSLTALIIAETSYHLGRFRESEKLFKAYSALPNSDFPYANHAIAFSFYNYYRYNNAAYYWLRNLQPQKSFYDSLAVYNLSLLYTHTENFSIAETYFRSYLKKYSVPDNDSRFVSSYLRVLREQKKISTFRDFYEEYGLILHNNERFESLLLIGDYFWDSNFLEAALSYYQRAIDLKPDEELLLRTERIQFLLGEYDDSEDFVLSFIEKYPDSLISNHLAMDIVRFYFSQQRYDSTVRFIDNYSHFTTQIKTLEFLGMYKALAYREMKKTDEAIEILVEIINTSTDNEIRVECLHHLELIFTNLNSRRAIAKLNSLFENYLQNDYLLILAKVYEKAYIYEEANNIYELLLESADGPQSSELYYRLAINAMYTKEYQQALFFTKQIDQETLNFFKEDVFFLQYLANYSLGNYTKGARILLQMYTDFPESGKRYEIIKNLVELFIETGQTDFSSYFVERYYSFASPTQRFALDQYKRQLAMKQTEITNSISIIYNGVDAILTFLDLLDQVENN